MLISLCRHRRMSTNRGCQATGSGRYPAPVGTIATRSKSCGSSRLPPQEGVVEILVIIVIAVLILGVAVGPLLAMRSPAEADKLTPGADPASRSGKEPDASETPPSRPRQAHRGPAAGRATCADDGPRGYDLFKKRRTA